MRLIGEQKLNRNKLYGFAASGIVILLIVAGFIFVQTQKPYIPKNNVHNLNTARSRELVLGKGYKADRIQRKIREKEEKKQEDKERKENKLRVSQNNKEGPGYGSSQQTGIIDSEKEGNSTNEEEENNNVLPEDEDEDEENRLPTIETNLRNGQTVQGTRAAFYVIPKDYKGRRISPFHVYVYCNGTRVTSTGDDGSKISYRAYLSGGYNEIRIKVNDKYGNSSKVVKRIKCNEEGQPKKIGTARFSVRAHVVGLGYILPRQTVDIYKGDQASNVLDRGLKANGYSYGYTGSLDRGFYLASIRKPGIGAAASVPETLQVYLEDTGLTIKGHHEDRLGENDFVHGSGWMYSVGGVFYSRGMSEYTVEDGDDIEIVFTLHMGYDVNGKWKWQKRRWL